jgi:16S rRNA processing protein RimM
METILKEKCRKIGFIRKSHGVKGEVILEYEPALEYSVAQANRFFIDLDGLLVPFFVSENGLQLRSFSTALVKFDWVENEKDAHRITGREVYLFLTEVDDNSSLDLFSKLVNYSVYDENNELAGVVAAVDDFSGNIVLKVVSGYKEFLIPYHDELLISIDKKKQKIKIQIPEGLPGIKED